MFNSRYRKQSSCNNQSFQTKSLRTVNSLDSISTNETSPTFTEAVANNVETEANNVWNLERRHFCAPSLPRSKRRVLFVELQTWDMYYSSTGKKTGEYYMSASWDYALSRLDFTVDWVSRRYFLERMSVEELEPYHRIFYRDVYWHDHFDARPDILCKVRPMHYFGEWYPNKSDATNLEAYRHSFDPKQIVVAHPEDYNTFLGYFPHNLLDDTSNMDDESLGVDRGRVGLLYGKRPEYFERYMDVITELIRHNFTLHTTCQDTAERLCNFPKEVIRHEHVGPEEYSTLMSQFSFLLGFVHPPQSPSPLVGLSHGVAFLNPFRDDSPDREYTQHKALSRLGMPYVYNVNLNRTMEVVRAAEWAVNYRFESFTPWEFRVESLIDRMCGILEDDALCLCPNPIYGKTDSDWKAEHGTDERVDCRASTRVKKGPAFPPNTSF